MITLKTKKNWQQRIAFFIIELILRPLHSQKQLNISSNGMFQNIKQWDGFFMNSVMWVP